MIVLLNIKNIQLFLFHSGNVFCFLYRCLSDNIGSKYSKFDVKKNLLIYVTQFQHMESYEKNIFLDFDYKDFILKSMVTSYVYLVNNITSNIL